MLAMNINKLCCYADLFHYIKPWCIDYPQCHQIPIQLYGLFSLIKHPKVFLAKVLCQLNHLPAHYFMQHTINQRLGGFSSRRAKMHKTVICLLSLFLSISKQVVKFLTIASLGSWRVVVAVPTTAAVCPGKVSALMTLMIPALVDICKRKTILGRGIGFGLFSRSGCGVTHYDVQHWPSNRC